MPRPFSASASLASAWWYYTLGAGRRKPGIEKRKEGQRAILLCSLAIIAKQETEKGTVTWSQHLPS